VIIAFFDYDKNQEAKILLNKGESAIKLTLQPTLNSLTASVEKLDKKIVKKIEIQPVPNVNEKIIDQFKRAIDIQIKTISRILEFHKKLKDEPVEIVNSDLKIENKIFKRVLDKKKISKTISKSQESDLLKKGVTVKASSTVEIRPVYPPASKRRGEEGIVIYLVEILPSGKVGNIQRVQSSGYYRLDHSALEALKKAHYIPALKDRKPTTSKKIFKIRFEIEESK
jgi:TonB family protein